MRIFIQRILLLLLVIGLASSACKRNQREIGGKTSALLGTPESEVVAEPYAVARASHLDGLIPDPNVILELGGEALF